MKIHSSGRDSNSEKGTRPEHEMLFLCSRTTLTEGERARIGELTKEGIDWEYLFQFAGRHSVLPLLYHQLKNINSHNVPEEFNTKLRAEFKSNAARNLFLTGELLKILKAFEARGIVAVPFKGPGLAVEAYGDLSLRRFVDLDVLVRKRDVVRAKEVLLELGYDPWPRLTEAQESVMLRTQHNLPFAREGGRIIVELHWEVVSRDYCDSLSAEELFHHLETIKLGGAEVKWLLPEQLLIALCVHGAKHYWERLAWVCDIGEIIRSHPRMDWKGLVETASRAGCERMLYLGLLLAREILGAALPEDIETLIRSDENVRWLSRQVRIAILSDSLGEMGLARGIRFNLRARGRMSRKLKYLRFAFSPTDGDLLVISLPSRLSLAYYLIRPFRMLSKN